VGFAHTHELFEKSSAKTLFKGMLQN